MPAGYINIEVQQVLKMTSLDQKEAEMERQDGGSLADTWHFRVQHGLLGLQ